MILKIKINNDKISSCPNCAWEFHCCICGKKRKGIKISVISHEIDEHMTRNVRYCNDSVECLIYALCKDNWTKKETI